MSVIDALRARGGPAYWYLRFILGLTLFILGMSVLEAWGMDRTTIGTVFLTATVLMYSAIGIVCRTSDDAEYFVAGRRVSPIFNGAATAADWMSSASFIGLAGALYLQGFGALAYTLGWTGGFVLMAVLIAPYLRRLGRYTVPDFFGARYGGHVPRLLAAWMAVVCSFIYVVAQLYGVGLITTRLTQVPFEIGVWLGLGGVLVCSFLGGMKAVTWTQVAQYIVLAAAYLIPVLWLSWQQVGQVVPQFAAVTQLARIEEFESRLRDDPNEHEVRSVLLLRAEAARDALLQPGETFVRGRERLQIQLETARRYGDQELVMAAERNVLMYPRSVPEAEDQWRRDIRRAAQAMAAIGHTRPFPGDSDAVRHSERINMLALVFCLMLGTASLPHVLVRSYTTPTAAGARSSIAWALLFMCLLYLLAPALAILVKAVVYGQVIGSPFDSLPSWLTAWQKVAPTLLSIEDINHDGLVQRAEIELGADIVVLAAPEIAGLPFVISALVAAGGLAAALSTADGLLLTITNAIAHDSWYRVLDPGAPTGRRVLLSKIVLMVVAGLAAVVASRQPADILFLVGAAFSLAAGSFFPSLVAGIFWRRANGIGAICSMLTGFLVTMLYMALNHPGLRSLLFGIAPGTGFDGRILGIQPAAAGIFGVVAGTLVLVGVSLCTRPPCSGTQELIDRLRHDPD